MSKLASLIPEADVSETLRCLIKDPDCLKADLSAPFSIRKLPALIRLDSTKSKTKAVDSTPLVESVPPSPSKGAPMSSYIPSYLRGLLDEYPKWRSESLVREQEVDEEALMESDLNSLVTVQDVVAFFARNGGRSPLKFIYLVRAEGVFRPYDLLVTSLSNTAKPPQGDNFTISPAGLSHIIPGRPTEFIPLSEWMHETVAFGVISSLATFRNYSKRKALRSWRENARQNLFLSKRKRLAENLLLTKPLFSPSVLTIKEILGKIEKVPLLSIAPKTYQIYEFSQAQHIIQQQGKQAIESYTEELISHLDKFVALTKQQAVPTEESTHFTTSKSKSMVSLKNEKLMQALRLKVAKQDVSRLPEVLKMIDVMLKSSLVTLVVNCSQELRERLENTNKLFSQTVSFNNDTVELSPSREEFSQSIDQFNNGLIELVSSIPQICMLRQYDQILAGYTNESTTKTVLLKHAEFIAQKDAAWDKLEADLGRAQSFALSYFNKFRPISDHGESWNEAEYVAMPHVSSELSHSLALMRAFADDLDKFKVYHVMGVILIDGKKLRARMTPIPQAGLAVIRKVLYTLVKEQMAALNSKYEAAVKAMDRRPSELGDFIEYLKKFTVLRSEISTMREEKEDVEALFTLLKTYGFKIPAEAQVLLEGMQLKADDFTNRKFIAAASVVEELRKPMIEACSSYSTNVDSEAGSMMAVLNGTIFVDPELIQDANEVLNELQAVNLKVTEIEAKVVAYKDYTTTLDIPCVLIEGGKQLRDLLDIKESLWSLCRDWTVKYSEWMSADFSELNVMEISSFVDQITSDCGDLTLKLGRDDVVLGALKTIISNWRNEAPPLEALRLPTLRPRHFDLVSRILGVSLKGAGKVTLQSLIENGLQTQSEAIIDICRKSSGELPIEEELEKILNSWEHVVLPVSGVVKGKPLLGDLDDILKHLSRDQERMSELINSEYSFGLMDRLKSASERLKCAKKFLLLTVEVHNLFNQTAHIKAEKFWRELLRDIDENHPEVLEACLIQNVEDQLQETIKVLRHALATKNI